MFIKGVGMTKFDYSQKPWWKFAFDAAMEALEDARMRISQIDCIVFHWNGKLRWIFRASNP
jgi:3-oxoacyl-[acyl-carrier-protein] synthase III